MMLAYVVALTVATADGGAPKSAPFADVSDSKILEPMPVRAPGPVVNKQSCKNMQMFRGQRNADEILRHCDEHDRIERQYAADIEAWRKRNGLVQARMMAEEGGTVKRVNPFVGVANRAPDYRTPDQKYLDERDAKQEETRRERSESIKEAKDPRAVRFVMSAWACYARANIESSKAAIATEKKNARRLSGVVDLALLHGLQNAVVAAEREESLALAYVKGTGMKPFSCDAGKTKVLASCFSSWTGDGCDFYAGATNIVDAIRFAWTDEN